MKKSKEKDITLTQLRTLVAICDNDMNVTAAAEKLNIAQPSVSKKLSALEAAIGKPLFYRNGKRFQYETDLCREVTRMAREILLKCDNLSLLNDAETQDTVSGELLIGTTHMQARYILPKVLTHFRKEHPNVVVNLYQGLPVNLARRLGNNQLDFVICTEALETNSNFCTITSLSWNRCLLVPKNHPLATAQKITLPMLTKYPIVTYVRGITGRAAFDDAFSAAGLTPRVMVSGADADIIKTYVRLGFGIGIVADIAYEKDKDRDLISRPLEHLFPQMQVRLAYQRDRIIPASMQRFIELFCQQTKSADNKQ